MDGMKPPNLPEQPVGVIRAEQLVRLLKTCEARDFTSRRDTAIILLLVDTGMRRAECVGMTVDDVDLDQRMVWVLGKGHRPRALLLGRKTAQALDRYLRVREEHRLAYLPNLWVGRNGPMTPSGVYQVVHDRARAAGLPAMHPHQLRHAFATSWLAEGGKENELMLVAGWKSRIMIDRYTKATAAERARAAHARLSPADRLYGRARLPPDRSDRWRTLVWRANRSSASGEHILTMDLAVTAVRTSVSAGRRRP
jgi:site-specific recombinase XerD